MDFAVHGPSRRALLIRTQPLKPTSHECDVEARDPDKLRDPLGAGTTLAASFGVESTTASGSAGWSCPGGMAAQPPVHAEGPREAGSERVKQSSDPSSRATDPNATAPPSEPSAARSSLLDTLPITRRNRESDARWIEEVGVETRTHREARAQAFEQRATRSRNRLREAGFSEPYVTDKLKWSLARAVGQRERPERVAACGSEIITIVCQECKRLHERSRGCKSGLLCAHCRGAIASEKRGRLLAARADLLDEAGERGLLWPGRRGGSWTEKLVTLTLPHESTDTVGDRIERLLKAWPPFLRRINDHWRERDAHRSTSWYRSVEWTEGSDRKGHPHFHIWMFCPWLDRDEVLVPSWRQALLEAGAGVDAVNDVIVDVRKMDDTPQSACEVIKYLIKDLSTNGEKVAAPIYARVYEAFDGKRLTQGSAGFLSRAPRGRSACECGSLLPRLVRVAGKAEKEPVPA